ncbi:hypothetical protein N9O88_01675 [bacterium]|nr:hypothetical protein [bacterium]|tara:strand:- start:3611 stop:3910 length:300 start_codon:yes stop_codon:yes gene_type:complete
MTEVESELTFPIPGQLSLQHSCKLAITEDRPIMLDYWTDSHDGKIVIGVRENGEKLLVKNEDEYTSPISKIYKVDQEYIIITENSLYLVSAKISTRRIS